MLASGRSEAEAADLGALMAERYEARAALFTDGTTAEQLYRA